jgi:hypothetical protein
MLRYLARLVVGLVVAGYGVWVAWPLIAPVAAGGDLEAAVQAAWQQIRATGPAQAAFWIGAAVLYLAAAVLAIFGHVRASGAYLLAFLSEINLRLLASEQGTAAGAHVGARARELLSAGLGPIDPDPIALATLAILGLIVLALEFWPRAAPGPSGAQTRPSPQQA